VEASLTKRTRLLRFVLMLSEGAKRSGRQSTTSRVFRIQTWCLLWRECRTSRIVGRSSNRRNTQIWASSGPGCSRDTTKKLKGSDSCQLSNICRLLSEGSSKFIFHGELVRHAKQPFATTLDQLRQRACDLESRLDALQQIMLLHLFS
jgi:hypothetical protein